MLILGIDAPKVVDSVDYPGFPTDAYQYWQCYGYPKYVAVNKACSAGLDVLDPGFVHQQDGVLCTSRTVYQCRSGFVLRKTTIIDRLMRLFSCHDPADKINKSPFETRQTRFYVLVAACDLSSVVGRVVSRMQATFSTAVQARCGVQPLKPSGLFNSHDTGVVIGPNLRRVCVMRSEDFARGAPPRVHIISAQAEDG